MAIGIQNYPNIIAASSDYLKGRVKDNPGDGTGTPLNQFTNGDIQEFFSKLLGMSGITAGNTPDNETNGHQYIQAATILSFSRASKPIIEGLIGTYTANDLIVIKDVVIVITGAGNIATWTAGFVYYNGVTYIVDAGTLTKSSGVFLYTISSIDLFKITISSGTSGTGIADYAATSVKRMKKTKRLPLGNWNMHSSSGGTQDHSVAHGLNSDDWLKMVIDGITIILDDSSRLDCLSVSNAVSGSNTGVVSIGMTNINLTAVTGGGFDSALHSASPFNRGWMDITYGDI